MKKSGKKGRPHKPRKIEKMPEITQFSPRGKAGRPLEIILSIDELEALKLADFQGLEQKSGAVAMGISRPTFGRILRSARRKVADAVVNGRIIRIFGGPVRVISSKNYSVFSIKSP